MSDKCSKCGAKFVRYPIKDENGKLIIKNLFKMDMMSILFLICVIFMTIGYIADMNQCRDAINDPCKFCEDTNCCLVTRNVSAEQNSFEAPQFSLNTNT
jgi:cell division protein FtsL